eukprot:1403515-Lingulodinium_polyedra.AAC.1
MACNLGWASLTRNATRSGLDYNGSKPSLGELTHNGPRSGLVYNGAQSNLGLQRATKSNLV